MLLGVLGYLKYAPFLVRNLNFLAEKMLGGELYGSKTAAPGRHFLLYIAGSGVSGRCVLGEVEAEATPGKLALFLGFFPRSWKVQSACTPNSRSALGREGTFVRRLMERRGKDLVGSF